MHTPKYATSPDSFSSFTSVQDDLLARKPAATLSMSTRSKAEKNPRFGHLPLSTSGAQATTLTVRLPATKKDDQADQPQGNALLRTPYFNKGSAFTKEERSTFQLHGLLPDNVQTLDEQVKRAYAQYNSRPNDLAKNTFMTSLKEQNEVLYYKVDAIRGRI